jgi:hypothetical protein
VLIMVCFVCPWMVYSSQMLGHSRWFFQDKSFFLRLFYTITGMSAFIVPFIVAWMILIIPFYIAQRIHWKHPVLVQIQDKDVFNTIMSVAMLISTFIATIYFRWTIMSGL